MLQGGEAGAVGYLLLYNLAFIIPLLIIFILAYGGMKYDALIRFQANHTAAVKFATAALFATLALFLFFGHKLMGAV